MSVEQKPIVHGRDHHHRGADPVRIAWEDTGSPAEGGGGIQFDTKPQTGDWLYVQTTGYDDEGFGMHFVTHMGFGVTSEAGIVLGTPSGSGASITFNADDFLFQGGGGVPDSSSVDFAVLVGGTIRLHAKEGLIAIDMQPSVGIQLYSSPEPIVLIGDVKLPSLPTTDPFVSGQLWNSGGTVKVSA